MSDAANGTLNELLSEYLDALDRGESPQIEVLCRGDEKLALALKKRLGVVKAIDDLIGIESTDASEHRSPAEGETVGGWRVGRPIGEGGFGSVYEARRTDGHDDRAAIKLLHRGAHSPEARSRFQTEAQALAIVRHPNVASILDSGVTEAGTPYLVLELVEGDSIDRYCRQHGLSITDRVRLMLTVCRTIEHAHAKGVIHRDLKPSNILVTNVGDDHVPKLIDFGIARFIEGAGSDRTRVTAAGQMIGTARYMSPEQLGIGNIARSSGQNTQPNTEPDTKSDIYSLGVLLYELVAGLLPYDDADTPISSVYELQQRIRSTEPRSLASNLSAQSTRDSTTSVRELSWIVMRCLELDPERRYATCRELVADLQRLVSGEAVLAGPRSRVYLARKFVGRHRAMVGVASVACLGLVVSAIGTSWGLVQARRETARALTAEADSQRIIEFQYDMLRNLDPAAVGTSIADEVVARASADAAGGSGELAASAEALVQSLSMTDIGTRVLGATVFEPALRRISSDFADSAPLRARLMSSIGKAQVETGLVEEGIQTYRAAYELLLNDLGPDAEQTLVTQRDYADALRIGNRAGEALAILEGVQNKLEAASGQGDAEAILAMIDQGSAHYHAQQLHEAEKQWRNAYELAATNLGSEHELTYTARGNLGLVLTDLAELDAAEEHLRAARAHWIERFGLDHQQTVISTDNLARCLVLMNNLDESLDLYRDIWDRSEQLLGKGHPNTLRIRSNFISALIRAGEYQEALGASETHIAAMRADLPSENPYLLMGTHAHGKVLIALNRDAEALDLLSVASREADNVFGPDTRYAALLRMGYAEALAGIGEYERALEHCDSIYATLSSQLGPRHAEARQAADLAVRVIEAASAASTTDEPHPHLAEWRDRLSDAD